MRADVRRDFEWQRPFIPVVAELVGCELGPYLFREAGAHEDMHENSDLIILQARDIRVGCRVRKPAYNNRFPFDVTFRCWRQSNVATELDKVLAGWGHAFFYGIAADAQSQTFARWSLLSLQRLRSFFGDWDQSNGANGLIDYARARGLGRCGVRINNDQASGFVFFDLRELRKIDGLVLTAEPAIHGIPRARATAKRTRWPQLEFDFGSIP